MSEPNEIPNWVANTPNEQAYELNMFDSDDNAQQIEMSRDEFIALKAHLAALRGYALDDVEALVQRAAEQRAKETGLSVDLSQAAVQFSIARDYYRKWPALVLAQAKEVDEEVSRLEDAE
jgi:hypothetical protein